MATQQLMLQILRVDSSPDNICFVGVIDGDNRSKINKVLQKAAKAVENRIKEFKDAFKSVRFIDSMSPEEIFAKFFSDQREIVNNTDKEVPKKVYRRIVPMRQAKLRTVDLTADEDDEVSQAENTSLTSSCFCSEVSISESCSSEKARKLLIKKPMDPQMLEDFIRGADVSFKTETRSLESLEKEFVALASKMYQRQEDEDIEREKRWKDDYSKQGTKTNTKREKNCLAIIPSSLKDTKRPESPIPFRCNLQASSSSAVQKDSNDSRRKILPLFESTSKAEVKNPSTPRHSRSSLFSHHQIPLTDPADNEKSKLLSRSPRLGRGLNEKEGFKVDISLTKKRLLDAEDYLKYNKNKQMPKLRQSMISTPSLPALESSKIPDKIPTSEQVSKTSTCHKSPIRSRRPISDREADLSSNYVESSLLRLMQDRRTQNVIPASSFSDKEDVVEVIDLDEDEENNSITNNQEGKKRKLSDVEPQAYKIFSSKNKPNFSNYNGSE